LALGDGLAFLAADAFADDADTLALVGLRRVVAADLRGDGADELLVRAFDLELGLGR
jgi:hypothetical protein